MEKIRPTMPIDKVCDCIAAKLSCDPRQIASGVRKLFARRLNDHQFELNVADLLAVPDMVGDAIIREVRPMTEEQLRKVIAEKPEESDY